MVVVLGRVVLAAILVCFLSRVPARGSVLFSEAFDYANGSLLTGSTGAWSNHSGTTGQVQVASGRALLSQTNSEDVSRLIPGYPFGATTSVVLYASFTLTVVSPPSGNGGHFAHFKDTGASNHRGRLFITTNGVAAGYFRLGIANGGTSPVLLASNLAFHVDYRVVTCYVPSNATSLLWLNPAAPGDFSVSAGDAASTINTAGFALRESLSTGDGMGSVFLDDLTVATAFEEVVSSPPSVFGQPQSQTVIETSNVTFTVSARGTPPLFYQWFLGTNALPGQTASNLTLTSVTTNNAGSYSVAITNQFGAAATDPALLTVNPLLVSQPGTSGVFSVLTYNVKGNGALNWSTNSAQVQAIARQLQYLRPDVITFQEIPWNLGYEMTNFRAAFLPEYELALSSGTDGYIRSAVMSRFHLNRTRSWLARSSLTNFGYAGVFTRDLFEAEVAVPNLDQPLHVFTTHLKSGSTTDDAARRAAEASSISNFLVSIFLPANGARPYLLAGDFNEWDTGKASIQRLISAPTDLHLTAPVNPFSGSYFTFSIQSAILTRRFDYLLPCSMLLTNISYSEVFRTDLLTNPPAPLLGSDSATASDHLPVLMCFNNPFNYAFQITAVSLSNDTAILTWQSVPQRQYQVYGSSDARMWALLASNIVATGTNCSYTTSVDGEARFFRVYRTP